MTSGWQRVMKKTTKKKSVIKTSALHYSEGSSEDWLSLKTEFLCHFSNLLIPFNITIDLSVEDLLHERTHSNWEQRENIGRQWWLPHFHEWHTLKQRGVLRLHELNFTKMIHLFSLTQLVEVRPSLTALTRGSKVMPSENGIKLFFLVIRIEVTSWLQNQSNFNQGSLKDR
jgi:hypothetical protein